MVGANGALVLEKDDVRSIPAEIDHLLKDRPSREAQFRQRLQRSAKRFKPLVDPGGYIPCPDHRIAPDAERQNVSYDCERTRSTF